jgi:hypothetical protein
MRCIRLQGGFPRLLPFEIRLNSVWSAFASEALLFVGHENPTADAARAWRTCRKKEMVNVRHKSKPSQDRKTVVDGKSV